jgi:hypothetical protein
MTKSEYKLHSVNIAERIMLTPPIYEKLDIYEIIEKYETESDIFLEDKDYFKLAKKIKRSLNEYINYRELKRSISKFQFSKSDEFCLIGLSIKDKRFKCYTDYYHKLISLDDALFEKFSVKYINLLFCDFAFVSRRSSDGGIDFLGKGNFQKLLNLEGSEVNLKAKDIVFKVLGQSKRYSPNHKIGTKEIREFLGSVKILQEALNPGKVSAWLGETLILENVRLADPFIYLFITTSHYSKDSIDLAQKLGIYTVDLDDLIFDLITHNVGIEENKLNYSKFVEWIKKD